MRLCTFEVGGPLGPVRRVGMLTAGGPIVDLNLAYELLLAERDAQPRSRELAAAIVPPEMVAFIENGRLARRAVDDALAYLGSRAKDRGLQSAHGARVVWARDEVRLLAPIPRPRSMRDCLAFEQHLKNFLREKPVPPVWYEIPVYYKGNPNTVQGTDADVNWPSYTEMLDYELEFAAVIGKTGVNIPVENAWSFIFGYTVFNDVSARDIQLKEMGATLGPAKGKDLDGGNILGPFIVTADEWDPREDHAMVARVNGQEWSRGTTKAMYHDFGKIVSYISKDETLVPGDVIGSGTVGTGCGLELGRYPKPGDVIELEVDGIGTLRNRFVRVAR